MYYRQSVRYNQNEKGRIFMNKAKRVAWHKHLAKAKKLKDKRRAAQKTSGTASASTTRR
jgi:hypothetical protein